MNPKGKGGCGGKGREPCPPAFLSLLSQEPLAAIGKFVASGTLAPGILVLINFLYPSNVVCHNERSIGEIP